MRKIWASRMIWENEPWLQTADVEDLACIRLSRLRDKGENAHAHLWRKGVDRWSVCNSREDGRIEDVHGNTIGRWTVRRMKSNNSLAWEGPTKGERENATRGARITEGRERE